MRNVGSKVLLIAQNIGMSNEMILHSVIDLLGKVVQDKKDEVEAKIVNMKECS